MPKRALSLVPFIPLAFFVVMAASGIVPPLRSDVLFGYLHEAVAGATGAILFLFGLAGLRKKHLIENTPTSKIRSAAMGPCEITGIAREKSPLVSPYSGAACVFCRYKKETEVRGNKGRRYWKTVSEGSTSHYFYIEDATGRMLVDPLDCESILDRDYQNIDGTGIGRCRYTEWILRPGDYTYVLGTVGKFKDADAEHREKLAEALRKLKADAERMKSFDTDGDGRIDGEEWDRARAAIEEELRAAETTAPAQPEDDLVIARGEAERTFIISDQDEGSLARRLAVRCWSMTAGGFALAAAMAASCLGRTGLLSSRLAIPWEMFYR